MKEINGIKTNLGGNYSICSGDSKATMSLHIRKDFRESDDEMFERLSRYGYKKITFYYTTTRVRGCYDLIAYCKRK